MSFLLKFLINRECGCGIQNILNDLLAHEGPLTKKIVDAVAKLLKIINSKSDFNADLLQLYSVFKEEVGTLLDNNVAGSEDIEDPAFDAETDDLLEDI